MPPAPTFSAPVFFSNSNLSVAGAASAGTSIRCRPDVVRSSSRFLHSCCGNTPAFCLFEVQRPAAAVYGRLLFAHIGPSAPSRQEFPLSQRSNNTVGAVLCMRCTPFRYILTLHHGVESVDDFGSFPDVSSSRPSKRSENLLSSSGSTHCIFRPLPTTPLHKIYAAELVRILVCHQCGIYWLHVIAFLVIIPNQIIDNMWPPMFISSTLCAKVQSAQPDAVYFCLGISQ
jgi:hypothetical protein